MLMRITSIPYLTTGTFDMEHFFADLKCLNIFNMMELFIFFANHVFRLQEHLTVVEVRVGLLGTLVTLHLLLLWILILRLSVENTLKRRGL